MYLERHGGRLGFTNRLIRLGLGFPYSILDLGAYSFCIVVLHNRSRRRGAWTKVTEKRLPFNKRIEQSRGACYYSAFGLALRATVGHVSGVQRGQTPALVGALRLTLAALGAALKGILRRCTA